ncbi:hypothetical protein, partial [Oceanobacillus damuensis]|uniref:hypothetical protein n=1 Tax=Oceanobacillus damuensis TaxID=937928 RepID=UPI001F3106D4
RCLTYASAPAEVSVYFPELVRSLLPIIILEIANVYGRIYVVYFKNAGCAESKSNVLIVLAQNSFSKKIHISSPYTRRLQREDRHR